MALVTIPSRYAQRAGIRVQGSWLATVEAICRQFQVKVSSGYRTAADNKAAHGASNSDHLRGDACDFVGGSRDLTALHEWASGRFPYVEPMTQAKDHVHISFRHGAATSPAVGGLKRLHPLAGRAFVKALQAHCVDARVDWHAAAAVGIPEGASGKVGDDGTSYGPWQLHIGGALPKRWARLGKNDPRTNAWCWSSPGIAYAIAGMAKAGARGMRGKAAIATIVRDFEQPKHPEPEIAKANEAFDQMGRAPAGPAAWVASWYQGPSGGAPIPTYTPPPADPAVQTPLAAAAWAGLMGTLGRQVPKQSAQTRAIAHRLRQAVQ